MAIKNDIKNGVKLAADAATDVAQALIEKSRLRANASRIKQVIKGDTELRNQAYIELGRYFYEQLRDTADDEQESLCVVIDKTSKRIDKATSRYLELVSLINDTKISSENTEKIRKIMAEKAVKIKDDTQSTVKDIADKAKETGRKAKDTAADLTDKAKDKAADFTQKAKETVAQGVSKAKDKVDDFRSFIAPGEEEEDILEYCDTVATEVDEQVVDEPAATSSIPDVQTSESDQESIEIIVTDDEESPDEFDF